MGVIRLYVPNRAHGDIIGPGGKTLKAISAKCGVTISVPRAHEQTSVIRISGEPAGLKAAQSEVEAVLGFAVGTDPLTKAFLAVPKAKHSRIVGKGAEILKSIENASNCNVYVPGRTDPSSTVEVEGPGSGIKKAIHLIEEAVGGKVTVEFGAPADEAKDSEPTELDLSKSGPINQVLFFPDHDMTDGWNYDEFLRYLRSAKKSFDACVFTITDNRVAEVMEDLHARGIKVRLITDNDTAYADGSDIKRLFKAGIPVKVDKSPHHMHNKFVVLDGVLLLNGSYNWTVTAHNENRENIMITNLPGFVNEFQKEFNLMWSDSRNFQNFA